ncbi:MAG: PEGA domain-containing protein [Gallionella sp.]|nr:PEGA domain-containing protein [Gallionella sp.]MDD4947531.1 PEGA domain-containing protein [Gallionella sp.]
MSSLLQRAALVVLLFAVAGCSAVSDTTDTVTGWFKSSDNTLAAGNKQAASNAAAASLKYGATLRVNRYVDQRKVGNPRYLGEMSVRVSGLSGNELVMDQDVADIVTGSIKKRFDTEGFQIMEGTSAEHALFEVSGVVKQLTLNIKNRDEITIAIETTLKDVATGQVVWSGLVTQNHDRFAGVSGNNKDDVVAYLNSELRIASGKAVEAISTSLMAARPELFNLTPGTRPVKGVTVYVAPTIARPAAAPTMTQNYGVQQGGDVPASTYRPHASETAGLLLVTTNPPRARVYLDGVYYGLSPLRLEMEPGVHAISVKQSGYKMVTEKVSVRRGDNTEMELNLEH